MELVCSLCVDVGFLWASPTIQRRTGELETVESVNMNVCDGLAIRLGVFLLMTQERLQTHDPT